MRYKNAEMDAIGRQSGQGSSSSGPAGSRVDSLQHGQRDYILNTLEEVHHAHQRQLQTERASLARRLTQTQQLHSSYHSPQDKATQHL